MNQYMAQNMVIFSTSFTV